jgi:hypothetical protein
MYAKPDVPTEVITLPGAPPPRPRPRRRRTAGWLIVGVVIAVAAGTVVVVARQRAASGPAPQATTAAKTAKIERKDLSTTRTMPGTIGYGAARPLAGHQDATVTWLPRPGATIARGKQLFRADDKPVILFYGTMPLYRAIAGNNLVGKDVRIIADNLKSLGYAIGRQPAAGEHVVPQATAGSTTASASVEVKKGDGVLTDALIAAIKRWQTGAGLPVTGRVEVGDVEVQDGAVRIDSVAVQPGTPANAQLMSVTSTRKVITVSTELTDAAGIERADRVTIALPDDRTVKARVTSVGKNLTTADGSTGDTPKLTVTITAEDAHSIADLDSAAVEANFTGQTVRGVLAVPIEALVALTEGGYAVQIPTGLVAVTTGMFADGWVEINGAGITAGTDVVVSS